jgi:hypothetical protein
MVVAEGNIIALDQLVSALVQVDLGFEPMPGT